MLTLPTMNFSFIGKIDDERYIFKFDYKESLLNLYLQQNQLFKNVSRNINHKSLSTKYKPQTRIVNIKSALPDIDD